MTVGSPVSVTVAVPLPVISLETSPPETVASTVSVPCWTVRVTVMSARPKSASLTARPLMTRSVSSATVSGAAGTVFTGASFCAVTLTTMSASTEAALASVTVTVSVRDGVGVSDELK